LHKTEREADESGVVLAVLGYRNAKVQRQRQLPENRQCETDANAHAGADRSEPQIGLDSAGVGEDDAAEEFAGDGEIEFDRPGQAEVSADRIVLGAGAGADPAIAKPAYASQTAAVEPFEERRISAGNVPGVGAVGQDRLSFQ